MEKNRASETKKMNGAAAGGGGFKAKLEHVLYSGEKKHVIGGIAVIGVLFGVPWYFMTRERAGSAGVELSAFAYLVASLQTDVISSVLHKKIKHRIFVLSFWWWVREESLALFFYFLMDRICQEKQLLEPTFMQYIGHGSVGIVNFLFAGCSKQQSHQDYMEKADKARSARLSAGSSSTK
ncbi:putative pentatricopeptide repeat-containing protein, mitochondrial-like [Capsicum annuum]|nr:putative pentatricopeptide repeat-containing protein, mitochondrial-like [Capsicum annuum]